MKNREILQKKTSEHLSEDSKVLKPYYHIARIPGKQIRSKLAHAFNYWLNISNEQLLAIADIVQMLHNASLLFDDIEDNSQLRRGVPVVHSIYGIPRTMNSGNFAFFLAFKEALHLNHPDAIAVCIEYMIQISRGQGIELEWRDSYTCPSEEEYRKMIDQKAGGLFIMVIQMMQMFSENKQDFTKLIHILSEYFQIRDDYCNLCLQEYADNKTYCDDLTEGKFSLPIIHAIHSQPDDDQVINILRQRTQNFTLKKYCVSLLEGFGSFEYTRKALSKLDEEARKEILKLGGNPSLEAILDELLNWKTG